MNLFIKQTFIKYLLCARYYLRYWGYSTEAKWKKKNFIFTSLDVSGCKLNINKSVSKYLAARGWQVLGRKMQPSDEMPSPETKASLMRWTERKELRPKKNPSVRVLRKMLACLGNSTDNVAGAKWDLYCLQFTIRETEIYESEVGWMAVPLSKYVLTPEPTMELSLKEHLCRCN